MKENGLDSATGLTQEVSKMSETLTIPFTLCTGEAGSRCTFGNCALLSTTPSRFLNEGEELTVSFGSKQVFIKI